MQGFAGAQAGSTKVEGPGMVSFLATRFSASWKLEFNRPRIPTTIVAVWPNSCDTCGYGPWIPRLPGSTAESTSSWHRQGRVLSQVDIMLAALARQHKLYLLTTDQGF